MIAQKDHREQQSVRGHIAELANTRLEIAGDEASSSRLKDVHVYPVQHHKKLRSECDQEHQMNHRPH